MASSLLGQEVARLSGSVLVTLILLGVGRFSRRTREVRLLGCGGELMRGLRRVAAGYVRGG